MHCRSEGFTLVELLIVVTIIAILLTMIAPSVGLAFSMAQETKCNNNLKIIGKAVMAYTQRNNDMLPINGKNDLSTANIDPSDLMPGTNSNPRWWCNKIYPLGTRDPGMYTCASDNSHSNPSSLIQCSYGFNDTLTDPNSEGGDGVVSIMQIANPAETFLVGHCSSFTEEPAILEGMVEPQHWPSGHVNRWDSEAREEVGRCGFLLGNLDVKTLTYSQVKTLKNSENQLRYFHHD